MANAGEFREDLLYRLNGFSIKLPPLRERGDDLRLLITQCVDVFSREIGKPVDALQKRAALELLMYYRWPGNVRELEAVVRQAVLQNHRTSHPARVSSRGRADAKRPTRDATERPEAPTSDLAAFVDANFIKARTTSMPMP